MLIQYIRFPSFLVVALLGIFYALDRWMVRRDGVDFITGGIAMFGEIVLIETHRPDPLRRRCCGRR